MKFSITLVLLIIFFTSSAQDYSVEVFPNRFRLSYETVSMAEEPDLGFMGIGFDIFNLSRKLSNVYFGMNSYSTVVGERPGLITLGMSVGWRKKLLKQNLFLDIGGYVGGGGGAGAADGGGLIIRPHLILEKQFGSFGLTFGFSRIDFPSGEISGNQLNFGLTINESSYLKVADNTEGKSFLNSGIHLNKLRIAVVGTQYRNLKEGSVEARPNVEAGSIGLVGAQIERKITENFYGIFKINGAVTGGADGYLSILLGAGAGIPIIKNRLNLESRVLFGPSGGGAVEAAGGGLAQAEAGLSILLKNNYDIKLMAGKTFSPGGAFEANHIEFGIGKSFERLFPSKIDKDQTQFTVSKDDFSVNHMSFSLYNRTYAPPNKLDKNGLKYESYFNLLGFEFQKYISDRFSITAETIWAYQGDYGAYAEGLLGATYYHPIFPKTDVTIKAMFGAGGGGGIDLGSGLLFEYALGLERKVSRNGNLFVRLGRVQPLNGNFTPYSLDIGFKFHINQLIKK